MLWNTIKRKCYLWVLDHPDSPEAQAVYARAKQTKVLTLKLLTQWDIRQAGVLRTLVPGAFPKKLRTGELIASQNIHGAWRIDTK